MENKQTAVEFYRTELSALVSMKESNFQTEKEIFEQAKQMEKEQIINAYYEGKEYGFKEQGDQYYNETYQTK
jgi:hypothetical protein